MNSLEVRLMEFVNQECTRKKFEQKFERTIRCGLEESGWDEADMNRAVAFLMERIKPAIAVDSGV